MKVQSVALETQKHESSQESPSLNGVQVLPSGEVIVGTAFGHPLLRKVIHKGEDQFSVIDLKLEDELGSDAVAVVGGFKNSDKGDVDLVALHEGSSPRWLRNLLSKNFLKKSGSDLVKFLSQQSGAMGAQCSHLQYADQKFNVRRFKEAGMTWDIHYLGDFVFGLFPFTMWREPYLHLAPEKREALRKDLEGNRQLHRSEDGTFWALSQNKRLIRFQYGENKAKPTPLKIPASGENQEFSKSVSSKTDEWLYGVNTASQKLFRLRRNPISMEEELQELWESPEPITALTALDREENPCVVVSTASDSGAKLYSFAISKPEDPEMLPEIPSSKLFGTLEGVKSVSSLTYDVARQCLWAVEGSLGIDVSRNAADKLKVLRITEI